LFHAGISLEKSTYEGGKRTMKRFLNMKVGSKLVIAFLVVAAISAINSAIGIQHYNHESPCG
jgi:hypothetical protein